MLENIRQISVLNKVFNLKESEWTRVSMSWLMRFTYRVSFVIAWTIIVGLFVGKYGIKAIPYLFIVNAVFTMIGSLLYSVLLEKFKKWKLMSFTIVSAVFVSALALYLLPVSEVAFFALLIVAEAVFLMQLKVLMDGYIEEMFNPLESERTFPLIESSETIGGIIAGLIVVFLTGSIATPQFVYLMIGFLLLALPLILIHEFILNKSLKINEKEETEERCPSVISKFKKEFSDIKSFSFLKGLFLIVFLHWFLFNLLEFQYTSAIYQNVSTVVMDAGSGFEHAFVHDLGQLFILFSGSALLIQFFVGGRLINSLGVMGSMLIHPIITLLSTIGLVLNFSFSTAVLAKNNFTITNIIYTNAYHSSYYAIREKFREHTREMLEGFIRPLGAVFGTFALIVLQEIFSGSLTVYSVNILMVVFALVLLVVTYLQQEKYTKIAVNDLLQKTDKRERINAIDILAQKGHGSSLPTLSKVLLDENEPVSIRVRILRAFAELENFDAIETIVKCFKCKKSIIRETAIEALSSYKVLGKSSKKCLFIEYELVEALKHLYKTEKREEIRSKIIVLLSKLSPVATFDFLLSILKNSRGELKADAIYAFGNYDDYHIIHVIKPFLKSKVPHYKINAAIVLGQFDEFEDESLYTVYSYLHSGKPHLIEFALYAIGELGLKKQKRICMNFLSSKNLELRMQSALALAKMGDKEAIPVLIDLLFDENPEISKKLRKLLKNVDVKISKNIDKIVRHIVEKEVERLRPKDSSSSLEGLDDKNLKTLKLLYCLSEEYDEMEVIDTLTNKI